MFQLIDRLIVQEGCTLSSWNGRYTDIWAGVAPAAFLLEEVQNAECDSDMDMIPAMEYLSGADWLPFAKGSTFMEALANLEGVIADIPQGMLSFGSLWHRSVEDALNHLREVRRRRQSKSTFGMFEPLPRSFADLVDKKVSEYLSRNNNQANATPEQVSYGLGLGGEEDVVASIHASLQRLSTK